MGLSAPLLENHCGLHSKRCRLQAPYEVPLVPTTLPIPIWVPLSTELHQWTDGGVEGSYSAVFSSYESAESIIFTGRAPMGYLVHWSDLAAICNSKHSSKQHLLLITVCERGFSVRGRRDNYGNACFHRYTPLAFGTLTSSKTKSPRRNSLEDVFFYGLIFESAYN